jgi:hypothetical protein
LDAADLGQFLAADRHGQLDLKLQRPDLQVVAGLELGLRSDPLIVDVGPILAPEVAHRHVPLFDQQRAMVSADEVALGPEVAILRPANEELRTGHRHFLACVLAV